jgi:transcriptional regulator with XRE-family HTH domain
MVPKGIWMPRQELARFLRDRRQDLHPADVGLPAGRRRRTPGLRREEVAGLAHISVEYYARLEQARGPQPSPRILDAITVALRLTAAERAHLFGLASAHPAAAGPAREVRPHVVDMLRRMSDSAAIVTDATYDVIAWNPLAAALMGGFTPERNLARRHFLHLNRHENSGAPEFAEIAVARLRLAADRYPHDEQLAKLLAELHAESEEFSAIWATSPVRVAGHRMKTMSHPSVGPVRVHCDVLTIPEDDQQVVFITADPGSRFARALRHLVDEGVVPAVAARPHGAS